MRKRKQVYISTFLKQETYLKNKEINLENKNITIIDPVSPFVCSQIDSLNLHNNHLSQLKGIDQFKFLTQLNISNNKIFNCRQLLILKNLPKLQILYISNNPFLNEPLQQNILEMLLEKETDIEILSFEVLTAIKEIEQEQIKIIFLSNYLNKINLHEQLKQKQLIQDNNPSMKTNYLISKIIPQFYTIIEDPRINAKIKKQALTIKKNEHNSIEQAIQRTKYNRQLQMNELIRNIITVLGEENPYGHFQNNNTFVLQVNINENTITFSPQQDKCNHSPIKQTSLAFSPVRLVDNSKYENSLEQITLTNTKQFQQHKNSMKINSFNQQISVIPNKISINYHALDTNRTTPGKDIAQRLKRFNQSKIHKPIENPSEPKRITINLKDNANQNIKEVRPTIKQNKNNKFSKIQFGIATPNKLSSEIHNGKAQNSYITVVQEHQQEDTSQRKSVINEKKYFSKQSIKSPKYSVSSEQYATVKSVYNHNSQIISAQNLETLYFRTLAKTNSMFHLLYSPSQSLNIQQKNKILQALKIDHKQKFFELIRERQYSQNLFKQLQTYQCYASRKIQELQQTNREAIKQGIRCQQQSQWTTDKFKSMESQLIRLYSRVKQLESTDKIKSATIGIMECSFKKIKESYLEKCDQINLYKNYQQLEDIISSNREKGVKRRYLQRINKQSTTLANLSKNIKKQQCQSIFRLYKATFQILKSHRMLNKKLFQKVHLKNKTSLQLYFNQWAVQSKLVKTQIIFIKIMNKDKNKQFIKKLKANEVRRKVNKLNIIWADRHFQNVQKYKFMKSCKQLRKQMIKHNSKGVEYHRIKVVKQYFNLIKQVVQHNKKKIERVHLMYINNLKIRGRKHMLQTMKQNYKNSILQIKAVKQSLERKLKILNLIKLRSNKNECKLKKDQIKLFKKYLRQKYLNTLKGNSKRISQMNKNLKTLGHVFKNYYIGRQLTYEKMSFDYEKTLKNIRLQQLCSHLKQSWQYRISNRIKQRQLCSYLLKQKHLNKLRFIKYLQVARLKGTNYVRYRTIQQMNIQMQLNDNKAIEILRETRQQLILKQKDVSFLKAQIQIQSLRQMKLMDEKDQIMNTTNQSFQIMNELRSEIDRLKAQQEYQTSKYHNLAISYNECLSLLQKKEKDFEWLANSVKQRHQKY